MREKKLKGQFFTVNSSYILQGFEKFVENKDIIDPFAGNQDLIKWAKKNNCKKVIGFDCDKKYVNEKNVFYNDSINNHGKYKFVCTNPPYLHKNKADEKTKEKFFSDTNSQFEDLYQVSINSILESEEGILIVPLNFLSAENSEKIRKIFFDRFEIVSLNIFSQQVFEDTTYNVVSFYYRKRKKSLNKDIVSAKIFPKGKREEFVLEEKYGWRLGGKFNYKIKSTENSLGIYRLTEKDLIKGNKKVSLAHNNIKNINTYEVNESFLKHLQDNIIFLRAIDSKNGRKIQLEDIRTHKVEGLVGKNTSRNMAHLLFKENIPIEMQEILIKDFNKEIGTAREKYSSMFLTNFRDNNRKRIGFDFTYKLINYLYFNQFNQELKI